jgi:acetolactate synthase-1/2/3 large subunit
MGKDAISSNSRFKVGMIGSYGNRWANRALMQSDLLLVLGSRLDIRQTGSDLTQFSKNRKIIRVDIDETEITGRVASDVSYTSPLSDFFSFFENFQHSGRFIFRTV